MRALGYAALKKRRKRKSCFKCAASALWTTVTVLPRTNVQDQFSGEGGRPESLRVLFFLVWGAFWLPLCGPFSRLRAMTGLAVGVPCSDNSSSCFSFHAEARAGTHNALAPQEPEVVTLSEGVVLATILARGPGVSVQT